MLSPADDLLIHQTPETLDRVFTSDRRFYDRHFFTGHACSEEIYFMLGVGNYPNLSVCDAFVSISYGDKQYAVRASRELGPDRANTENIGPFSLTVIEGLKTIRVTAGENEHDISFDLTWHSESAPIEEPVTLTRSFNRVTEHLTRFVQTGRWSGWIEVAGDRLKVDPETWWGQRDRSWGVRDLDMEPEPAGFHDAHDAGWRDPFALWIWSPMQFPESTLHFNIAEQSDGQQTLSTVRQSLASEDGWFELTDPGHDLQFKPGTREIVAGSQVSFADRDGQRRVVTVTPLRKAFLNAGTGYGAPDDWRHGMYKGPSWVDGKVYDLSDPDLGEFYQMLCRFEIDGVVGYGVFDYGVLGAFEPYGFTAE